MYYGLALPAGPKMQPHQMRDTGHCEECASQATGIADSQAYRYDTDRKI